VLKLFLFVGWLCWTYADEMTPQVALKKLMEGNERYCKEKLLHPNRGQETRLSLAGSQNPFAAWALPVPANFCFEHLV